MDLESLKTKFQTDKQTEEYQKVYTKENPLVTINMTTFNRCKILLEYSLPAILNQTYKNIEVIVVGDRCTDNTEEQVLKIKDSRLKFYNISDRPDYPEGTGRRWLVAGTYPFNHGLSMATGDFISHCDDDDCFTIDKIEKLVKFIQQEKCDAVHHPFNYSHGLPLNDSSSWFLGRVTTSALFMHNWFKNIPVDSECYKIGEPGDWNRCKKIQIIGADIKRHPETLTKLKAPIGYCR